MTCICRFKLIVGLFSVFVVLFSTASAQIVFPSPDLTGPYEVGRTSRYLVDEDRPEIFTDDEGDVRELMITVMYPAEPAEGAEPAPLVAKEHLAFVSRSTNMPEDMLQAFQPHAYPDATVVDEIFPVILYSPGMVASHAVSVVGRPCQ